MSGSPHGVFGGVYGFAPTALTARDCGAVCMRATAAKATTNTTVRTRLETRRCLVIEVVLTGSILQVDKWKKWKKWKK
jgi:hypothetical protein